MNTTRIVTALALTLLTPGAMAADAMLGDLELETPFMRATPPRAPVAGGYVVIRNHGETADRLIAGAAAFAGRVEIHEMKMNDGVMVMRELPDGLEIPAGGEAVLKPGGYHIMFIELSEPISQGEPRTVSLTFEQAGSIDVEFEVVPIGGRPDASMGDDSNDGGHAHGH